MSKTNSIRLASVALALLLGSLGHERRASATDLPDINAFTNFTLGNQPNSEGVIYTTGAIIDYPKRFAPSKRKVSYMVPVGFNAQRVPVITGKKFGLIVVLHGGGGNGAAFANDFYTNLIGSGYAFVFPWAATWLAGTHFQTIGTGGTNCDGGPIPRSNASVTGTECLEDVKFVQYMRWRASALQRARDLLQSQSVLGLRLVSGGDQLLHERSGPGRRALLAAPPGAPPRRHRVDP